jgi:hypothetical protein
MSTRPAAAGFPPELARLPSAPHPLLARAAALVEVLEREAPLVLLPAIYAAIVLVTIPQELVADSWLTLVSGREVAEGGIPTVDRLTVWTSGVRWVDQQWLAQLFFYGAHALGGLKLVLLLHAAALTGALAMALAAARSLGASVRSVSLVAAVCMLLAPWALAMRAQTLAIPMFVALVWLLASDSRSPSRRVYLVLPLLALWANVHGTVVLACVLVVLRGVTVALSRREDRKRLRATLLISLPFAAVLASPYGTDLVGYYRTMLVNPELRTFISEWGPSTPSALTALFYLTAFGTVALLARCPGRLTAFERLALLLTMAAGVTAIRSILWFGLAALVLVPQLLDGAIPQRRPGRRHRGRAGLGVASAVALVGASAIAAAQPQSWFSSQLPHAGGAAVARFMDAHPRATVMADDRYGDWLLWEYPQLAGRLAYDARFELFTLEQLEELRAYRRVTGTAWDTPARKVALVAFDPRAQRDVYTAAIERSGARIVYRDPTIVVAAR